MTTPASNLSGVIAGGQTLSFNSGSGAIANGALVQTGGPGNEAWPVVTIDHAVLAAQQVITPVSVNGGGAVNNYTRWDSVSDTLGNMYVATPNTSGQGVNVTKFTPSGVIAIASTVLDSTAHAMISIRLVSLTSSALAAVYVDSTTGGVRFTIFDSGLNIVAGPTAVATGYLSGAVAYVDTCALSAGGFAIIYANNGHTAINLQTYNNAGGAVLAATNIQTTAGTASLTYLKIGQLSSGNLVVAMRQTATPAGTSFVIVTASGGSITANTIVDATSTLGFAGLSVLPTGGFAVAVMDGTNIVAAAYSAAGVLQGSAYTASNTLNNTTYIQMQLANDGTNFYLFYVQTAGGLAVTQLTAAGVQGPSAAGLLSATFTSTSSIGASISNNMAVVVQASVTTGGQKYATFGLADASIAAVIPNVITQPTAVGMAAGTTGCYWPSVRAMGDFTAFFVYDQQSTSGVFGSLIKFAASAIQGIAQNTVAANTPGSVVTVNPGSGSYPTLAMTGTNAVAFDHSNLVPPGNRGVLFSAGATLSSPASNSAASTNSPTGAIFYLAGGGVTRNFSYTAVQATKVWEQRSVTTSFTLAVTVGGVTAIPVSTFSVTGSQAGFYLLGAGQTISIVGNLSAGGDSIMYYAEKDQ